MNKRNTKCTCGSGKKYKNCCGQKQPRTIKFDLDPLNIQGLEGLYFRGDGHVGKIQDGKLVPFSGTTAVSYGRKRKKKDTIKPITYGNVNPITLSLNPDLPLGQYDHIFVIDTNTIAHEDEKISVSAIIHGIIGPHDSVRREISYTLLCWFEFRNIKGKEENLAWAELIRAIGEDERFPECRIGIVVDSDLGNIEDYNARKLPIYGDIYLPKNIELLYATSDNADRITNKFMRMCDKKASELLEGIVSQGAPIEGERLSDMPFDYFRQWYPNPDEDFRLPGL